MSGAVPRRRLALVLLAALATPAQAADLVALSPQTWERYIPQGKEVDGIYGDFALANDQLIAVIANPRRGRNANMTVREVGGCLIDLTRRDRQSDQLSAFYPGAQLRDLKFAGIEVEAPRMYEAAELDRVFVQARRVTLRLVAAPREKAPDVEVAYTLEDGWPYVLVTSTFSNRGNTAIDAELLDAIRADRSFECEPRGTDRPVLGLRQAFRPGLWRGRRRARHPGRECQAAPASLPRLRRKGGRQARPRRDLPPDASGHPRGEPLRRSASRRPSGRKGRFVRPARREGHGGSSRPGSRRRPRERRQAACLGTHR